MRNTVGELWEIQLINWAPNWPGGWSEVIRAADHLPSHCALISLLANCIICPHRPTNYRGIRPSRIIVRKCWIEDYWNRTNKVIFWSNWTFVFIQIMISAWIIEDCWWMVHCTIPPAAIAADGISQNCATHEIGFCASVSARVSHGRWSVKEGCYASAINQPIILWHLTLLSSTKQLHCSSVIWIHTLENLVHCSASVIFPSQQCTVGFPEYSAVVGFEKWCPIFCNRVLQKYSWGKNGMKG